jgi:hypothetical protein
MLSSARLVKFFCLHLMISFCRGDRCRTGLFPSTITRINRQSIATNEIETTNTLWLPLPRGGSTSSSPIDPQLDKKSLVPSLFQNETETVYDRYAACLAATEGLRRIRDQTLQVQQQQCATGSDSLFTKRNIREAKQWATAVYAENASKVIEAMGMPIEQFNAIGKIVCNDASLKQRVWKPIVHRCHLALLRPMNPSRLTNLFYSVLNLTGS